MTMMMMMVFPFSPEINTIIFDTTRILQTLKPTGAVRYQNLRIHEPGEANRQQSVDAVQNWHMLCQCRVIGRRVSKDGPCSSCSILSLLPYLIIFFALHLVFFLPLSCLFLCFFIFCFPSSYSHIFEMTFHFVSTTHALPRYWKFLKTLSRAFQIHDELSSPPKWLPGPW